MKHHPLCGTTYMEDCECETMTQTTPAPMTQPVSALLELFRDNRIPTSDRNDELFDLICSALARRPGWAEWQPIETAPKDGRSILLCWECGMYVGSWRVGYEHEPQSHRQAWRTVDGSWADPTHWMPKPTPPSYHGFMFGERT